MREDVESVLYVNSMEMIDRTGPIDEFGILTHIMVETFMKHGNLLVSKKRYNEGKEKIWNDLKRRKIIVIPRGMGRKNFTDDMIEDRKIIEFHKYLCDIFKCKAIRLYNSETSTDTAPCIILERVL